MTLVIDRHNAVNQNIINPFRILGHVGITVIAVQRLPVEDDDIRNSTIAFPTADMLKNCETYTYLGSDMDFEYNELWNEVKAY